ncbi:hypothetical protein [Oceanivirga salmonicida]|uniref:hypothetical protein n=1 Tax=Oceanivirga salmonicida TaxID=1769291 RepID=UPI00082DC901|nr:hypothetical protein [Oceanivirga salmonicida]
MKKLTMAVMSLLLMTSCATVVHGTKQKVKAVSNSGETIYVYDKYGTLIAEGNGTVEVSLARAGKGADIFHAHPNEFTFKTTSETKKLVSAINPAYRYGNPFTLGIGYLVDNGTGAGYSLLYNGSTADLLNFK